MKTCTQDNLATRYQLKTFQVRFVAEPAECPIGSACRASVEVERVARAIYETLDADKEHFVLLVMDSKNRVNGFKVISTGTLTASLVHPREVWRAALHLCAFAVIFVHNHPSGDPAPSPEDIDITRRLKETGDVLGIRVLDHVILGHGRIFSFCDRGLLSSLVF
jgi:DNA repair protein RadC